MIQAFGLTSNPRKDLPPAVDDVSFEARAGHVTALLGASGAGKTTVLRLMLELQRGRGLAHFRGRPLHRIAHPSREVGVVLGDVPGHPARTVRGHLRMLCAAAGAPVRRADEVLQSVGLVGLRDEHLGTLSRGMDRRLGLACALLPDPHTLVLDDPAGALSVRDARWLHQTLRAHAAQGGTVLFSTADPKEAARCADHVVTLDQGRVVADQAAADFSRTRLRPRVAVRSPHAARLAALLIKEARKARRSVEVVREGGNRLAVYGSTCADIGDTAFRHGILVHQLADEVGDMGPGADAAPLDTHVPPHTERAQPWAGGTGAAEGSPSSLLADTPHPPPVEERPGTAAEQLPATRDAGRSPTDAEPVTEASRVTGAPRPAGSRSPASDHLRSPATDRPHPPASDDSRPSADALRALADDLPSTRGAGRTPAADHGAGRTPAADRGAAAPDSPPAPGALPEPPARAAFRPLPRPSATLAPTVVREAASSLPPPISVRSAPSPLRPLRYELRRVIGVGTAFVTGAVVLVVSAVTAVILARIGHTPQPRLLAAWPRELPLPPAALGAGLLGALAFGDEFRHPALAADRGTVPRRMGLLAAKLLVSAATALVLAVLAVACDAEVLRLFYGREVAGVPADWPALSAAWLGLVVGCAWSGLLAAGVFRSTTAGLAAVVAVPVLVVPLVQKVWEGPSVRTAAGLSLRIREALLTTWPFGGERYVAEALRMVVQPVGGALTLSLTTLLCAYLLMTLRSRAR
ncbi:putative ABC transporter [Streptomyces ambofaciens ATCC 23877]|uniref:Putative ABC transporter n=1 Tax=Streptomyces ambofaciens (strain ATCC 23877 / 3486 / DSM 40053 / JCM 4204 / NBRC 12836 / NRRL B-2516) TaxID=278992 RepID=A0A0K2AZX9_STRA7|nr:ATP-binding cassette domain-containing protein [Streptomyces ambofaciens]AKZ58569.1 putative ABC transporter [Streptomyces ambofaciens ATCC 23877]